MREARETLHLPSEELGVTALEPVGAEDDDAPAKGRARRPPVQQLLQRFADPRAALPIGDGGADARERVPRVA